MRNVPYKRTMKITLGKRDSEFKDVHTVRMTTIEMRRVFIALTIASNSKHTLSTCRKDVNEMRADLWRAIKRMRLKRTKKGNENECTP